MALFLFGECLLGRIEAAPDGKQQSDALDGVLRHQPGHLFTRCQKRGLGGQHRDLVGLAVGVAFFRQLEGAGGAVHLPDEHGGVGGGGGVAPRAAHD